MENASKALLIAGGMLITILVVSLFGYLFADMGGYAKKTYSIIETNRISQFNSQFTKYEGRNDLTIQDVVTIANLARSNNESYNLNIPDENSYYIQVKWNGKKIENKSNMIEDDEILDAVQNELTYKCTKMERSKITGRINSIEIEIK